MQKVMKYRTSNVPKQPGEIARVKVVHGPDYGGIFVIFSTPVTIGRGEQCDIVISDLKASRTHAELTRVGQALMLKDLGSANGILRNGQSERQVRVGPGEVLGIGETSLEFILAEQGTRLITAPAKSLDQVVQEQSSLEEQRRRVRRMAHVDVKGVSLPANRTPSTSSSVEPKRIIMWAAVLGALAYVYLDQSPRGSRGPVKTSDSERVKSVIPENSTRGLAGTASVLPSDDVKKASDQVFKAGFREFREGNWIRARQKFETVLQLDPGHELARRYVDNCNRSIEDSVKRHLLHGRRGLAAGKLKQARGDFEAVLRLLYRDQGHPGYKEAKEALDKLLGEKTKGESSL